MRTRIDEIVRAFAPEMERITSLGESKETKVRIAESWLRARLEKFENEIRADCARSGR
jgi:hypothetical protein